MNLDNADGFGEFVCGLNGVLKRVNTTTTVWEDGRWYHMCGTYNSTNLAIYVNGTLEGSRQESGSVTTGTDNLVIGAINTEGSRFFNGSIDEVSIRNYGMSSQAVYFDYWRRAHHVDDWLIKYAGTILAEIVTPPIFNITIKDTGLEWITLEWFD